MQQFNKQQMDLNNGTYTKIALFVVIMCGFYYVVNTFSAPRPYPYYPQQQNGGYGTQGNSQVVMQQPSMQPSTPDIGNVYDAIHKFDTAKVIDPLQDPITRNSLLNYGLPYDSYRQVGTLKCIYEDPPLSKKEMWDARYGTDNTYDGVQSAPVANSNNNSDDESTNSRDGNGNRKKKPRCKMGKCKKDKVKVETFINTGAYNDILPLYGMQSNINTNIWFYYTIISDGNNSIKIMLNQPNNSGTTELWTGSQVYIPELNKTYEAIVNQTIFMTYG
jgi:hypothetical protein